MSFVLVGLETAPLGWPIWLAKGLYGPQGLLSLWPKAFATSDDDLVLRPTAFVRGGSSVDQQAWR